MAATGAVLYLTVRALGGLWTASGVNASADLANQRPGMPPQRQPFGYVNGDRSKPVYLDASWERFLRFQHEIRLGGDAGSTLPDVAQAVEATQTVAAASSVQSAAYAQQTQANAQALAAAVQVLQNNAVPGSAQIPPVTLNPLDNIP